MIWASSWGGGAHYSAAKVLLSKENLPVWTGMELPSVTCTIPQVLSPIICPLLFKHIGDVFCLPLHFVWIQVEYLCNQHLSISVVNQAVCESGTSAVQLFISYFTFSAMGARNIVSNLGSVEDSGRRVLGSGVIHLNDMLESVVPPGGNLDVC